MLRLALAVTLTATAPAADVVLPTYGDGYDMEAALRPIMPICLEALAIEMRGGSFVQRVDAATSGWPADRTWRVREICVALRTGAQAVALVVEAQRERARPARPSRPSLIPVA